MQHITMADKSLLVGDEVASLLMQYGALLAKIGSGDTVRVRAFGADGGEVVATFLLNSGTVLMSETTGSPLPSPDNREAEEYLRDRLSSYTISADDLISLGLDPEDGSD